MNNKFNYKDSLNNIKASLFDIYENQEVMIGLEENEEQRNIRLNNFIELKNISLNFINIIENLYNDNVEGIKTDNEEIEEVQNDEDTEETSEKDEIEDNSKVEEVNEEEPQIEEEDTVENEDIEEASIETEEDAQNNEEEVSEDETFKKYYLNCGLDRVNFAYVPQEIYEKIKNHKQANTEEFNEDSADSIQESGKIDNHFYKQDDDKARGIIVRSDQYMKLALSRYRQAGVLQEAKQYRIEEVKRRQRENQKKELEKAKLNFNI